MNLRPAKKNVCLVRADKEIQTSSIITALVNIFKGRSDKRYLKEYAKRHEISYREVCRRFDEQTGRTKVYVEEVIKYKLALDEVLI